MKSFLIAILMVNALAASSQEAPDLDRIFNISRLQYVNVDSLDNTLLKLSYYNTHKPSKEEQEKLMAIYKAASNGYSSNMHYKQGYQVYERYLSLKEGKLAADKIIANEEAKHQYEQKNRNDEAEVNSLQLQVSTLKKDVDNLISKRSNFKRVFSIVIVLLSALFAMSLFRSGVKLKALRDEVHSNQESLRQNHRLALLGALSSGLKDKILLNYKAIKMGARELSDCLPKDFEKIKTIIAKLESK